MMTYVWLLPIIFIFHDMEEIIGFIPWYKKNKHFLDHRYPKISKTYNGTCTEAFALAVYEELFVCICICIHALFTHHYELWLGIFIGLTLHFIIHIFQSLVIRQYIPATLTSLLMLPISVMIILKTIPIINPSLCALLFNSLLGILIIIANLKMMHHVMHKITPLLTSEKE